MFEQVDYLALLVVILLTIIALFSMRIFDEGNIGKPFQDEPKFYWMQIIDS